MYQINFEIKKTGIRLKTFYYKYIFGNSRVRLYTLLSKTSISAWKKITSTCIDLQMSILKYRTESFKIVFNHSLSHFVSIILKGNVSQRSCLTISNERQSRSDRTVRLRHFFESLVCIFNLYTSWDSSFVLEEFIARSQWRGYQEIMLSRSEELLLET